MGFSIFKRKVAESPPDKRQSEALIGHASLIYDTRSFERYNPDDLQIKKGNQVYKTMLRDEQIKAVLSFKKAALLARGYSFDIDQENPDHQRIADFFNAMIENMTGSFGDKIRFVLSGYQNGFSICEKVYDVFDFDGSPYWGVSDIKLKPFDTFTFIVDKYGNIEGVNQGHMLGRAIPVPLEKVIHWVHQPDIDSCYGESDLRAAYRAWWSKDIIIRFQNIHLERHGSGFPVISPDEKATSDPNNKNKLLNILRRITVGTGIILPKHHSLKLETPQRTDAYEKAISQHNKALAKSMMVPNLLGLSDQGGVGAFAQSKTQFEGFLWVLDDTGSSIAECLNEQMFAELALWNFGATDYPKFKFNPLTQEQKTLLAKTWSELVQKGSVENGEDDEAYTRNLLGYPAKQEVDESEGEGDEEGDDDDDETPDDTDDEGGSDEDDDEITDGPIDEFTYAAAVHGRWMTRVRFKELAKNFDTAETDFGNTLAGIMARVRLSLENQISKIAGDRSFDNIELKEFEGVEIPKSMVSKLRSASRALLQSVFNENYNRAAAELPKKINAAQIVGMDKTKAERFLASKSFKITDILKTDVLKAVQQILENGIKFNKSLREIILEMTTDTAVASLLPEADAAGRAVNVPARLENIARTNIADAVNQARTSLYGRPEFKGFIVAYQYSAILDQRVSDVCEALDGKVRRDWGVHAPPNHHQCRSILVPITVVDDWDGKESNIPATVKPLKGFG